MTGTLSSKGQITIPKRIRAALGLRPGTRIQFQLSDGHAVISAAPGSPANATAGALRKYAAGRPRSEERTVMETTKRRVAHEAARKGRSPRHQRAPQAPPRG